MSDKADLKQKLEETERELHTDKGNNPSRGDKCKYMCTKCFIKQILLHKKVQIDPKKILVGISISHSH
jgi:hypothetical protein